MIILDSAYKHGISIKDIEFVYNNAINSIILEEFQPKIMIFGFDSIGRALEIGYIENDRGECIITHAMRLRKIYHKFLNV